MYFKEDYLKILHNSFMEQIEFNPHCKIIYDEEDNKIAKQIIFTRLNLEEENNDKVNIKTIDIPALPDFK
jgi:hypothetical protein